MRGSSAGPQARAQALPEPDPRLGAGPPQGELVRRRQAGRDLVLPSAALTPESGTATSIGFDTATDDTVVCVLRDGEVVHEALVETAPGKRPRHATALLAQLERGVAAVGGWSAISLLVAGTGPGSFTGLRIGLATARGLRTALGLTTVGACTLDALAQGIGAEAGEQPRLAVIDARRGEVFAALYSGTGERVWEPSAEAPSRLLERLQAAKQAPLAAGSGAVRFRRELAAGGVEVPDDSDPVHRVSARHVCALGIATAGGGAGALEPIYLRPPDAERWRERDTSARNRR